MGSRSLVIVATALLAASPAAAQSLRGTVLDSASGLPLSGAGVTVLDVHGATLGHSVTGVDGHFTFHLSGFGTYRVRAIRIGYAGRITESIVVDSLYAYSVELALRVNPVPLDTLRVVAEQVTVEKQVPWLVENGFYERRRVGFGYFLTRREIERKVPVTLGDALQGIPRAYGQVFLGKPCRRTLVLDGVPLAGGLGFISPYDIEGVEVYNSPAGLPVQYAGNRSPCGAILIWTRR